jgi:hypothetical protein
VLFKEHQLDENLKKLLAATALEVKDKGKRGNIDNDVDSDDSNDNNAENLKET